MLSLESVIESSNPSVRVYSFEDIMIDSFEIESDIMSMTKSIESFMIIGAMNSKYSLESVGIISQEGLNDFVSGGLKKAKAGFRLLWEFIKKVASYLKRFFIYMGDEIRKKTGSKIQKVWVPKVLVDCFNSFKPEHSLVNYLSSFVSYYADRNNLKLELDIMEMVDKDRDASPDFDKDWQFDSYNFSGTKEIMEKLCKVASPYAAYMLDIRDLNKLDFFKYEMIRNFSRGDEIPMKEIQDSEHTVEIQLSYDGYKDIMKNFLSRIDVLMDNLSNIMKECTWYIEGMKMESSDSTRAISKQFSKLGTFQLLMKKISDFAMKMPRHPVVIFWSIVSNPNAKQRLLHDM